MGEVKKFGLGMTVCIETNLAINSCTRRLSNMDSWGRVVNKITFEKRKSPYYEAGGSRGWVVVSGQDHRIPTSGPHSVLDEIAQEDVICFLQVK